MFVCSHCDSQYSKWQGRCLECGKWSTIIEKSDLPTIGSITSKKSKSTTTKAPILDLADSTVKDVVYTSTKIKEFDRVLSGGIVSGSVILLSGEPGIGKSTLLAQLAGNLGKDKPALYVSGEESQGQVLMRFERLKIPSKTVRFSPIVHTGSIIEAAKEEKPAILIIDSIQTMIASGVDSLPGSSSSIRAATSELINFAKSTNIPVLIIGQVTKGGIVAGPKMLEHLVDTVLTLDGDEQSSYRVLRAIKNRFGSTDEVGIFDMAESGMISVKNPSAKFLKERTPSPGSAITCVMEGTRPFLLEIQALVEKSIFPNPTRRTSGFDLGRLQMLLAILSKHLKLPINDKDVYINVVGGVKIKDPSVDLAVCVAIISSLKNKSISQDSLILGEVGLSGEIRSIPFLDRRIKEAKRLGFITNLTPKNIKKITDI